MSRILVVGMGNVLLRDDGFGVEVARKLAALSDLPPHVEVMEAGIGGIHLVQRLMDGYDLLVVVDAIDRGVEPGTVKLLEVAVPDLSTWTEDKRRDFLADMHYATPSKAMILARALGVLPSRVFMVGCQASEFGDLGIGLTEPVQQAAVEAAREVLRIVWEENSDVAPHLLGTSRREGEERALPE